MFGERPGDEEREHDRQEQLQQQQQRAAQPLPRRVGLDVADQLLPQERAADRRSAAAQPQHVEGHDERDGSSPISASGARKPMTTDAAAA